MTTSRSPRGLSPLLLLLTLVLPSFALAAGENYGRVTGYVYDPTGSALAEVPLTISGPALQQPISRTSGEDGRYEFDLLPPGEGYTVEVAVEGFTPLKIRNIAVRLGQSTPVDVKLEVFTETQAAATYEITQQVNPIINPDSAQTGAVVTAEKAAQTPIFTQPQGVAQLVAGVGPGNSPSTRGGLSRWGKFYVDGMDTTDVSDGSITATMNYYAVENFEVITGGLDAQYNSLGVVQNIVTKTGSNRFTYDAALVLQPTWSASSQQFASNQPVSTGNLTQSTTPQAVTSFYSPVLALGGPLIKDRLWFYLSGQMNFSLREVPLTINGVQENRPRDTRTNLARLKLTWQPTASDRLSLAVNVDRNTIANNTTNANTALEAESRIARGGYFIIANYDRNLSSNVLFQLQTGATYKNVYQGPQNNNLDAVAHIDTSNNNFATGSSNSLFGYTGNYSTEDKYRFQFDPTLLFKLGEHQMKAGLQAGYLAGDQDLGTSGNLRYLDKGGFCDPNDLGTTYAFCSSRQSFYSADGVAGPNATSAAVAQLGAFVQDRWTINRQLTVVAGLRADVGRLYGNKTFVTNLVGIGPRVSATYDITNDRKTLLKGHYGRSNEMGDVFIAQHANPDLLQYSSTFNATTRTFPECDPSTPAGSPGCTVSGGANGRTFDKTHTPPSVDELSLGLHREVAEGAVLGLDLTYRRYNNMWIDDEVNQLWDPSGTRVIGYADPSRPNQAIYRIRNPDDAWRDYRGGDLWMQGNLGRWNLLASYTLAFNNGTVGSYFDGYGSNPRLKYLFEGPMPDDIRHTLKGAVSYNTPFGLDINLRARYLTGTPLWQYQTLSGTGAPGSISYYRSPRGTGYAVTRNSANVLEANFNDPTTISELRNPAQFILDAQVRYDLGRVVKLGDNKMELMLLITNVLNNTDATALYDQYGSATYGQTRTRGNSPIAGQLTLRFRN